ncbi:MarR family transcriptional regulator [Streptomyces sp. NPDC059355]|uniref:MarR family transcriptional regulator n=1 Tax=Streptomyces sp. NPDC059355 TaxID=3346811 RepID=UPI0036CBC7E8
MTQQAFDLANLTTTPLSSLNLTASQRSVLDWAEAHGGLFTPIPINADTVAQDCGNATSTIYESLARLTALSLLIRDDAGLYRINARYFFTLNPRMRTLVATAIADPPITPDARANRPRKLGNIAARRRKTIKPVN